MAMGYKPDGIAVMADFLDDFARIDPGLIWRLVVLMTAIIWIIGGCYSVLQPEKMLDVQRRWSTKQGLDFVSHLGLASPKGSRVWGYFVFPAGLVVLAVDVYLFLHPELMP
jgi:hypothetical protein